MPRNPGHHGHSDTARHVAVFVPLSDVGVRGVAVAGIVLLSTINDRGVVHGSRLQTAFTLGKLLTILLMIALGFALGSVLPQHFAAGTATMPPVAPPFSTVARDFLLALIAGLLAFGGWHMVTYAAEETRHPDRRIPLALIFGTLIVTVCYVALNAAYSCVLPLDAVVSSTRVGADTADVLVRAGGAAVIAGILSGNACRLLHL